MEGKSSVRVVAPCAIVNPVRTVRQLPPLTLSVNPAALDLVELSSLLAATGQNCLQFPEIHSDGTVEPTDPSKLKTALKNSMLVVSIHIKGDIPGDDYMKRPVVDITKSNWFTPFLPKKDTKKKLVAFGRAISDCSLTASIYDVAVAPSLQRLGLGRRVMQRLIRDLGRWGIWDIAVLVPPGLRPFFQACGFATDVLDSTTMVYTRTTHFPPLNKINQSVKQYGRKHLLVPSPLNAMIAQKKN